MLKRIHIKGYKSLDDVEATLEPLTVLFGANASGKSNFLDALQLLSKTATGRTLKEAFDPPYRGKPLESFSFGEQGLKGLVAQDRLRFSIEADLQLSDAVVEGVEREIRDMRQPSGDRTTHAVNDRAMVRERYLRYRIEVEMLPKSGVLRVADEYLAALTRDGKPSKRRRPFIERQRDKLQLRFERQGHPRYYDRLLDHSILSMAHYVPHYPHVVAAQRELASWRFFYFEPRERMRAANPVKEARHMGLMGEDLATFLNTLKSADAQQFQGIERALGHLVPSIDGIDVNVSDLGEVELRLREYGVWMPARVLSEGTLRMLGLLALAGVGRPPALVGFEEPENGVHPRQIELVAELFRTREHLGHSQYIVTTHSPVLPDLLPKESLFTVRREQRRTRIDPFTTWGPLGRRRGIDEALSDESVGPSPSERIMRGDFGALSIAVRRGLGPSVLDRRIGEASRGRRRYQRSDGVAQRRALAGALPRRPAGSP